MTTMAIAAGKPSALFILLRALKLPAFARYAAAIATKATREGWTFGQYLHHPAELEVHRGGDLDPHESRRVSGARGLRILWSPPRLV